MQISGIEKAIGRKIRLTAVYCRRILLAKNHQKCPWYKKLKANLSGGFLADQWILYDLDHNDRREYLSEYDWYRSRYINEPFSFLLNNKIIASEMLKQHIRVPENYVIKNGDFLVDLKGGMLGYNEAIEVLKAKGQVFIKPFDKGKGTDINLLSYREGQFYVDARPCSDKSLAALLKSRKNWYMSESVEQSDYASNLFEKTANTIRIITLRSPETKELVIFFAVQRIGTEKTIPVDNGSQGGLISKIDIGTGVLSEARSLHGLAAYPKHPDSHSQIEGVVVPFWEETKRQVLSLANKLPYMHFVAWDILMTQKGICVIEANTSSGVNIIQLWGGQRNRELGNFYRFHNIIN
jgi:hypothetical protein